MFTLSIDRGPTHPRFERRLLAGRIVLLQLLASSYQAFDANILSFGSSKDPIILNLNRLDAPNTPGLKAWFQ
ncbi:hypothetical protein BDZ91DRAFT_729095 [Kalaharituber pfeilii]|nr:hypothetical protein BDZ91DRAFT_729095 [Kalaharituber pfeilii]